MTPICCGKRATPYKRNYSLTREYGLAWESGFRCQRCGRIRIPELGQAPLTHRKAETQEQLDRIREEGIAFDNSLLNSVTQ